MKTHTDAVPVRLVILFVGLALMVSLGLAGWLLVNGKTAAEMVSIALACITGLLALLGSTRTGNQRQDDAAPVAVTTPPGEPLQVTETPKDEVAPTT